MKFVYKGPKKSAGCTSVFIGFLVLVGVGAFMSFLSLIDDASNYILEIFFFCIVLFTTLAALFRKKAKLNDRIIEFKDAYVRISKDTFVPVKELHLDVYFSNNQFNRYHFWDAKGRFAIFSAYDDDLCSYIQKNHPELVKSYSIHKTDNRESVYTIHAGKRVLSYSLETGKYVIADGEVITMESLPEYYSYDGKYKTKSSGKES